MIDIKFAEYVKPIQIEVTSDCLRATKGLSSNGICGLVLLRVRGCVSNIPTLSRCLQPTYTLYIIFVYKYMIYMYIYMGVSKNRGTPKSSMLIGFSIINHPFWGTPIFGNTHIYIYF